MRNIEDLYRIQEGIASKALVADTLRLDELRLIAGADQAFLYPSKARDSVEAEKILSALVVLEYPTMRLVEHSYAVMPVDFPYVPGLLSFREAPVIINAYQTLNHTPDLLLIDGCGINHPRFAGLATSVGVALDIPTIGVAKNILCGMGKVPNGEGEACIITYRDRAVGYYLKSKKGCKPIIIAPGHKISLQTSLKLIQTCIRGHKLPEPLRLAHLYAHKIKNMLV
ncbi:MAG: endonuclease V [Methanophagales archaeon ANME-1-THS]|nr:MAG: endonuclease V [Methanophagales archaeon ANME-1-THS]